MAVFQNTNSNITTTVANGTGSLSLVGNLWTSANAYISGDLTVDGNVTYINITSLNVQDPIISLGRGPNDTPLTANDGKDRGENMWYYTTAEHSAFIGFRNNTGCLIAATNVVIANEIVTVNDWGTFRMGNVIADELTGNLANIVGNINAGNFRTAGLITATGNVTGGNIDTAGLITAAGNITTGANVNVAGLITAGGNITSNANINVAGLITAGGNITSNANVNVAGLITAGGNITSNANIRVAGLITAGGNITSNANVNVAGLITATGNINTAGNVNVAGLISATGNIIGGNLITNGSANVGSITISGNLDSGNLFTSGIISATGNITTAANVNVAGLITAGGNITSNANVNVAGLITAGGNITSNANVNVAGLISATGNIIGGNLVTAGNVTVTGNVTVAGWVDGAITYFTGAIAGNVLTVTSAVDGTIARGQTLYGNSVAANTVITLQLTQSSGNAGGNGTYRVSGTQTVSAETMSVNSLYLDGDLKLAADHGIYVRDASDPYEYDNLIGISEVDATILIGSVNTNGVTLDNNKEYKVDSALNPGTYMAVAKVDAADQVILSSGNAANTLIRVGGDSATTGYGMKLVNGGEALIPVGLRIGDNTNSSIFGAPLEVGSILGAAANNQSSPAGVALPTYRGTGTIIPNDEWGSYIYGSRYRGTINSPLPTKDGDWLMEFGATSFDGTNNNGGGEMAFRVDGTVTGTANPSRWELYVTPSGSNSQTLGLKVDSNLAVTAYGNIGTSGNISATANIISGNILTGGLISATGNIISAANITGGNILTGGLISATGNATFGNVSATNYTGTGVSVTGNITGGNLSVTGNIAGNVNGFAVGYLNIPQVSLSANTTTAASDTGKHYYSTSAANLSLTIANNSSVSWAVGTTITVINQGTGTITIGQDSGVSMYFAGNSTAANRSLTTFGMATIINVASNTWFINGSGVY